MHLYVFHNFSKGKLLFASLDDKALPSKMIKRKNLLLQLELTTTDKGSKTEIVELLSLNIYPFTLSLTFQLSALHKCQYHTILTGIV